MDNLDANRKKIAEEGTPCLLDIWPYLHHLDRTRNTLAAIAGMGTFIHHALAYALREGKMTPEDVKEWAELSGSGNHPGEVLPLSEKDSTRWKELWATIQSLMLPARRYWFEEDNGGRCKLHCYGRTGNYRMLMCGMQGMVETANASNDPEFCASLESLAEFFHEIYEKRQTSGTGDDSGK